jgi:hypothetical protein
MLHVLDLLRHRLAVRVLNHLLRPWVLDVLHLLSRESLMDHLLSVPVHVVSKLQSAS